MEFSGRLATFPLAELLNWAATERCTGALVFRRSSREKRVYFRDGAAVACVSDVAAEFYGQHLLLNGYLDRKTLLGCLRTCKEQDRRLGLVLLERGVLERGDVQRSLRHHIEELICDLFLWRRGIFYFRAEPPPEEEILADPIDSLAVTLEGTRWIDEMQRIRTVVANDQVLLRRTTPEPPTKLTPRQRRMVDHLDKPSQADELYKTVRGSYFRFFEALFELRKAGVIEVEEGGAKGDATTLELPLYDLLLEQAAEEQVLVSRKHLAIPLEVIERYSPVWARRPDVEEWRRMPEWARDFFRKFDGKHRLLELFDEDPGQRSRETELLLLQMRKEAVALVPASLDTLEQEAEARGTPEQQRWWRKLMDFLTGAAEG